MPLSGFSETLSTESRKVKVHFRLHNGRKISVPIAGSATITELQIETIRRASRAGISCTVDDTLLQEDGGAILFGEDLLEDLFDLTHGNTLQLVLYLTQHTGHPEAVRGH